MKKVYIVLIVAFLSTLAGCASIPLEVKWRPLKQVKESWIQPSSVMTTIGDTIYTNDLKRWQEIHPIGSVHRGYTLRHERVHSFRQAKYGLPKYLSKYTTSKKFRWKEERLGNYVAINYLKSQNVPLNVNNLARFLSGPAYGNMVGMYEAKTFVLAVVAGTWIPDGELPTKVN